MDEVTDVRLVIRESDKAYIDSMLWLPKSSVRVTAVQDALQYWRDSKGSLILETLWDEAPEHICVPREFITPDQYQNYSFPFIDLTARIFPRSNLADKITLRDDQVEAWEALKKARGGILNLACGKGKTILALKKIAEMGAPALVVVNDGLQIDQWVKAINEHLDLPPGEKVGIYQAQTMDWKRPITVAVINTLAARARDGNIPPDLPGWFGSVWYDEIHHLAAPLFMLSAPVVLGQRYGLTATADRLDQLQWVYNYHVGNVFFSDLSQDLIPNVYFQQTPIEIDLKSGEARDKSGQVNISKLRTFLGRDPKSIEFRYQCIKEAYDSGRKILAIGHSIEQLEKLSQLFPGAGLITGATPQEDRIDIVRASRLSFAIAKLGKEALDDEALDTLFLLTPLSSPNDLQQMLGRIQRSAPNKLTPVAIIFDDTKIRPLHYLTRKLRKTLNQWGYPFTTLKPPAF